ncbi:MAG: hypothetical protein NT062_14585 [Proteobacteria bacterium]|nr:hypothetical protein [Pseudomonadota bacterium]
MTNDEYLQSQIMPMLQPGEQVLQSAYMRRQPGLAMQILLVGGLLLFLITKAYFVVLTNRRMILVRTKMSFWTGGPQQMNLGVEQWDVRNIASCSTSGIANNKSMTWVMHSGPAETLRISPWQKKIQGTPQFLEQVPNIINSQQLQQLAAGAPQMQLGTPMGQPMMGAPQQMQQMPPQHQQQVQQQQQQQGLQPGMRVMVTGQDGNRHQAVIAQIGQGQHLCQMPDGNTYWIPQQNIAFG